MNSLAAKTVLGLVQLTTVLGCLLFGPSWTLDYWQAWVYLLIFAASSVWIAAYLWRKDRKLLERRLSAGPGAETEKSQKSIQVLAILAFIGTLVVPSLDHRFSWSSIPLIGVIVGELLVALGFLTIFFVFRENSFAAAAIAVAPQQKVVSTGPYALVRHPMYSGALVMLFGTPLALGSWWGMMMFIPMAWVILWRALDEEQFLQNNLFGYMQYCQAVRCRLVPFIW